MQKYSIHISLCELSSAYLLEIEIIPAFRGRLQAQGLSNQRGFKGKLRLTSDQYRFFTEA